MSLIKAGIICATAAFIFVLVNAQSGAVVEPNCLGCLCEASTNCNVSIGCHVPYQGAYFCGPFLISWVYWADAGKPVLKNDDPNIKGAFENCVNDLYCAAETVRLYMAKFATKIHDVLTSKNVDCNGDGVTDCLDFVMMHRLGGYGCNDLSITNQPFYQRFQRCWDVVTAASS